MTRHEFTLKLIDPTLTSREYDLLYAAGCILVDDEEARFSRYAETKMDAVDAAIRELTQQGVCVTMGDEEKYESMKLLSTLNDRIRIDLPVADFDEVRKIVEEFAGLVCEDSDPRLRVKIRRFRTLLPAERVQYVPDPAKAPDEKRRRVYYQDIVYQICNALDRMGGTIVCGTVEEPSTAVQTRVLGLIAELQNAKRRIAELEVRNEDLRWRLEGLEK